MISVQNELKKNKCLNDKDRTTSQKKEISNIYEHSLTSQGKKIHGPNQHLEGPQLQGLSGAVGRVELVTPFPFFSYYYSVGGEI